MLFGNAPCWFAIQVKSGLELRIGSALNDKGYETFVPTYQLHEAGRVRSDRPLFSGYVFCRFDPLVRAPIVTTPGVIKVVGYGKQPASIEDSEMEAVRRVAASNLFARPHHRAAPGHRVRIAQGPLRGLDGEIARAGEHRYFVVSLSMLQRSIAVEVEPAWLELPRAEVALAGGHIQ
jgi:transcription antitermination factor NusG